MTTGQTTSADVFKGRSSETESRETKIAQPTKKAHEKIVAIKRKVDKLKTDTRRLLVELDDINSLLVSLDNINSG